MLLSALGVWLLVSVMAALMKGRSVSPWGRLTLAGNWFVASTLWKVAWTHSLLSSKVEPDPFVWVWTVFNIWLVLGLAMLAGRWHALVLWLASAFTACLFWFDLLYQRFFDDIPGLYLLTQLSQGPSSAPSAWAMRQSADLGLFIDLPWMALAIFLWGRAGAWAGPIRRVGLALCLTALVCDGAVAAGMGSARARLLRLRFKNIAIVQEIGLYNYHFYDLFQHLDPSLKNPLDIFYDTKLATEIVSRSRRSIEEETPYRGVFKGCNLLMIQLESFQGFVVDRRINGQEIVPYYNQLKRECIYTELQDQSGQGRSSDGEFIMLNSLLPPGERPLVFAFPDNHYRGLPAFLSEAGYRTIYAVPYLGSFWNCRYMSERYGFQKAWLKADFSSAQYGETLGWGLTDEALYRRIIPRLAATPRPFFLYLVTLMGHHPYKELSRSQELLDLPEELEGTMLGRYFQECRWRDEHLRKLVTYLQLSGLWDNTVVVLFGDHDARMPSADMAAWLGRYDEVDQAVYDRIPLLIHGPGGTPHVEVKGLAGQLDATPTLMHLLGLPARNTAFLGVNFLSKQYARKEVFSKGGYGLNASYCAIDKGVSQTVFNLSDHMSTTSPEARAFNTRMLAELDLAMDILRLDLVPKLSK